MSGMGVGVGDYYLDGHLDIVRTHFYNQSTGLYRNDGKGDFDDVIEQGRPRRRTPLHLLGYRIDRFRQ